MVFLGLRRHITPSYGAGVQLVFFVVSTTKKADGTQVAHELFVMS